MENPTTVNNPAESQTTTSSTPPQPTQTSDDIVDRVAKMKNEPGQTSPPEPSNEFGLTKEDYEAVKNDPVLSKHYKSMLADYTRKTQEVAELRRKTEESAKTTWTPERLKEEINKPDFLQSAQSLTATQSQQQVQAGLTDEEWSVLNDKEKAQLVELQKEVTNLKQINLATRKTQEDAVLQQKYAEYKPQSVDDLWSGMMNGRVHATREHLWKVIDYDKAVDRAYQLGRQDERDGITVRAQSITSPGTTAQASTSVKPEEGETSMGFWRRIAKQRLAESKSGTQQRM